MGKIWVDLIFVHIILIRWAINQFENLGIRQMTFGNLIPVVVPNQSAPDVYEQPDDSTSFETVLKLQRLLSRWATNQSENLGIWLMTIESHTGRFVQTRALQMFMNNLDDSTSFETVLKTATFTFKVREMQGNPFWSSMSMDNTASSKNNIQHS